MYLVKIGIFARNSQKIMDILLFFDAFPYFVFVVFYQLFLFERPCWSKIERKIFIFPIQNLFHGGYFKWHKKSSLWRLCCVTQTSL